MYFFTLITSGALLGLPLPHQRLRVQAYVSLGSHGEYAQEQLTIYASGAPTFSEREERGGQGGMRAKDRRAKKGRLGGSKPEWGQRRKRQGRRRGGRGVGGESKRERERGRERWRERGKEAVLFVACQQLLETSFPSMCESYLAGMLGLYQVELGERGEVGSAQEEQTRIEEPVCG